MYCFVAKYATTLAENGENLTRAQPRISAHLETNKRPLSRSKNLMAQSIPSLPSPHLPPGICHFDLEKLQMPQLIRAGRFIQKLQGGALK